MAVHGKNVCILCASVNMLNTRHPCHFMMNCCLLSEYALVHNNFAASAAGGQEAVVHDAADNQVHVDAGNDYRQHRSNDSDEQAAHKAAHLGTRAGKVHERHHRKAQRQRQNDLCVTPEDVNASQLPLPSTWRKAESGWCLNRANDTAS